MVFPSDHIFQLLWMLPLFLYAEIHYRIAGIVSRYFKREPEIIADIPTRLEPGQLLPVMLLIKDAHRFPIELERITIMRADSKDVLFTKPFSFLPVDDAMWWQLFSVAVPNSFHGMIRINVQVWYQVGGKKATCINDNYALTSHEPLEVYIDHKPRPRLQGWYFGDMHTHSHLTSDQVEFGAPFDVTAAMCRAMGLHFFASADHSYDLDDRPDDYLTNDLNHSKWHLMWERVERMNMGQADILCLPGEELSAGNSRDRNVHFLIFNNRRFFAGSGDSAERWPHTKPEIRIGDVMPQLESSALAIASHPEMVPPFLQRLLLRRGKWENADYVTPALLGVQMWNGDKEHFLARGLPRWKKLLLAGHKLTLFAGSDAHGNFNCFRQIGLPHFTMREEQRETFGSALTGVFINGKLSLATLIDGLRAGQVIVTDGPFAAMTFFDGEKNVTIGESSSCRSGEIRVTARSNATFGELKQLLLIIGDIGAKKETQRSITLPLGCFEFSENVSVGNLPHPGYLRMELRTESVRTFHCFTNPIYFD